MGRKSEPGISYYYTKSNHTQNSKIKLLFNEFGADGYWIWKCLLDKIYEDKGYYFDISDKDELDLFATDVCKKPVAVVEEVIRGCVRRGLFDKTVFNVFGVLTSDRIQFNYLEATSERRRKGALIEVEEQLLVIEKDDTWNNVIITRKKEILPRKNNEIPRKEPILPDNSIVKESIVKGKEKSSVDKPQGREKPPTPFWEKLVETWMNFYKEKISASPTFDGVAGKQLKSIAGKLERKAREKNKEWVEDHAVKSLKYLLERAWDDNFIKNHFQLDLINSKFDTIVNQTKNGQQSATKTDRAKGNSQLLGSIKSDLAGFNQ